MDLSEPDEQPEKSKLLVLFKTTSAAGAIDKFSVPEAIGKDEKKNIRGNMRSSTSWFFTATYLCWIVDKYNQFLNYFIIDKNKKINIIKQNPFIFSVKFKISAWTGHI